MYQGLKVNAKTFANRMQSAFTLFPLPNLFPTALTYPCPTRTRIQIRQPATV